MTIKELIQELEKYDGNIEVVTCDGYGSVDAILKVSVEKVNDRDRIVPRDRLLTEKGKATLVLGWNH